MAFATPSTLLARAGRWALLLWAGGVVGIAAAQTAAAPPEGKEARQRGINEWLLRMHDASRLRSYAGTFVVSSPTGLASARIWHACEGDVQVERVESLTGARRSTFRRNEEVVTLLPERRLARTEHRESLGMFTDLLKGAGTSIPAFYEAKRVGEDRVAGFDTDVVQIVPKDNLRFGYRVWSEKKTGLVVKTQTLDVLGAVLEQAAFSELQLDAPVHAERLAQMMAVPEGWRVERSEAVRTTPDAEGWSMRTAVAGFKPLSCYKRPAEGVLQWIFSDGLASVSLFIEALDRRRHVQEGIFASGATHTLTRRVQGSWLTVVGEVPPQTLNQFAQGLEHRK
ncbi:MAG TPA: MucB/RseB C-terminal domain-containing protein [Ramlibacter sp.]|uniref:MucB/RseB C-terminal domain-containing protein n=1 Tax=Ramlibacter sp. TaxID=1917967 RepID=UPI002BD93257|nr:MucB/RseB C-terminal domain-containing protein [Ramlibacter sp.]HVZ45330.1 MucB/RseB C-terminal domain-containing protein [Ramlibacter sp.]